LPLLLPLLLLPLLLPLLLLLLLLITVLFVTAREIACRPFRRSVSFPWTFTSELTAGNERGRRVSGSRRCSPPLGENGESSMTSASRRT
jgi:hypothetical protein